MLSFFPLFCCVAGQVRMACGMRSMIHAVAAGAAALSLYLGCHAAGAQAQAQARVITSTHLPGGKYSVVYEYAGIEYFSISPTPPGETIAVVADTAELPQARWMPFDVSPGDALRRR